MASHFHFCRYMVKELLQLDFFLEDTGLKVELVSWYDDENSENDQVIQLRLRVVDPKKRKDKHKENEAIQFDFDLKKDNPEDVAREMVSKYKYLLQIIRLAMNGIAWMKVLSFALLHYAVISLRD